MRLVAAILIGLVLVLQYQYWWGRGGRSEVSRLEEEIARQQSEIDELSGRNATLAAEVQDLKQGMEAIEELARSEMGMIKEDEVFFQLVEPREDIARSEDVENDFR